MERATANGVIVPRGIVSRANNVARLISKFVTAKSDEQLALEGETLHQQILVGMGATEAVVVVPVAPGSAVVVPEAGTASPVVDAPEAGTAVPAE